MKTYSTILKYFLILTVLYFFTACGGNSSTHIGETIMSSNNLFTVTLEENLNDKNVTAEIELNMNNADIPVGYDSAYLQIDDNLIGKFENGFISFRPLIFGDVKCDIIFYNDKGEAITILSDTGQFYIETWYVAYNSSENGDVKIATNGNTTIYPDNVALGSCDMIWMYNIRIPKDKKIILSYSAERVTDNSPNFNGAVLDCHFRFADYVDRITTYGGLQSKYFDTEVDKWIYAPIELVHGVYDVYICPNAGADKSRLYVYHKSDELDGSFSAIYKTITNWPF